MFTDILFPTDGSDGTARALDHAIDIAAAHDATLHVLNVADTTRDSVTNVRGDVVDALEESGTGVVDEAAERASDRGVETVTTVEQGEPYQTIVDYATAQDVGLVVMPTQGRSGLSRLLLGSTTERVVRHSDVPVLTIGPDADPTYPYHDLLVPTDGSDCATAALTLGADLAALDDATLHLLSVVAVTSLGVDVRADIQIDAFEEGAQEAVDEAGTVATDAGVDSITKSVEIDTSIHRAILSYVDEHDIDVVVVGTHGRTGFDRYMLGSVTEKLVRSAPVPVLTVRDAPDDEE
ncbi:Nucleotide-binding universal stress protein, UspA family [Halogranum amylolyticum]|uniref:Nucleotide-binding universal stress protein, UspA family n=1 Tax=Halogranum amylolyticum TaxID=660520 RepID=A0A1H8US37_9EURY|nr:universal stress protein [Halogranum amylolyticum]SEP06025.1 Nucleotide-binding universal stress protein, UspA family [Halogranum amylolyticum]